MKLGKPYRDGSRWWQDVEEWGEGDVVPKGAWSSSPWTKSDRVGMKPLPSLKYRVPCEPPTEEWKCPDGWRVLADDEMTQEGDKYTHLCTGTPYDGPVDGWVNVEKPFSVASEEIRKFSDGYGHIIRRIEAPKAEPDYLYLAVWKSCKDGSFVVQGYELCSIEFAISMAKENAALETEGDTWHVVRCEIIGDVIPATYKPLEGK